MSEFIHLQTISDLFQFFRLGRLGNTIQHPLIAVVDFSQVREYINDETRISADFYSIMFKDYSKNNIKYGRKTIDFKDGSLICMAPNQVIEMDSDSEGPENMSGWGLFFHPDLIRATSLMDKMTEYSF